MPSHKVNPKILLSNLRVDGPLNNTTEWRLIPSDLTLWGGHTAYPVVVVPGAPEAVLDAWTLDPGFEPDGGVYALVGYISVIGAAPHNTVIRAYISESTGKWPRIRVAEAAITVTNPGAQAWLLVPFSYAIFGCVPPLAGDPPRDSTIGQLVIQISAVCGASDHLSLNDMELCGSLYAQVPVVGPAVPP